MIVSVYLFQQEVKKQQSEFRDNLPYFVSQIEREALIALLAFEELHHALDDAQAAERFSDRLDSLWARDVSLAAGSLSVEYKELEADQQLAKLLSRNLHAIDQALLDGAPGTAGPDQVVIDRLKEIASAAHSTLLVASRAGHKRATERRETLFNAYQKTVFLGIAALLSGIVLLIFFVFQNRKLSDLGGNLEALVKARTLELEKSRQQAENANASKSQFLANMSHELRTPLNAIIGFSDIMNTELFGPIGNEKYKSYVNDINKSASHLSALLKDILDLTKIEANETDVSLEHFDLIPLLNDAVVLLEPARRNKGHQLSLALPDSLWVQSDPLMIKQIVLNLLSNAYRYTPNNGSVEMMIRQEDQLSIAIQDNGVGMPPEICEHILEPFYQHRQSVMTSAGGTGVGLSLSNQLALLLGGQILIDSAEDQGTTASLVFPLQILSAEEQAAQDPDQQDQQQAS
ncbi:sensor histidine kinase [Rhodovibrionaceae bacterium A322]